MDELSPMGEFVGNVVGSDQVVRCTSSADGLRIGIDRYDRYDLPNGSIVDVTVFPGIPGKQKTFSTTITDAAFHSCGLLFPGTANVFKDYDKKVVPIKFKFTRVDMGDGMFVGTAPWISGYDHHGFSQHCLPDTGNGDTTPSMGYLTGHVEGGNYPLRCTSNISGTTLILEEYLRHEMADDGIFEVVLWPNDPMNESTYQANITDELFGTGQYFTSSMDLFGPYAGRVLPIAFRYVPPGRGLYVGTVIEEGVEKWGYTSRGHAAERTVMNYGSFRGDPIGSEMVNVFSISADGWKLALNPAWELEYRDAPGGVIRLWPDTEMTQRIEFEMTPDLWGDGVEYGRDFDLPYFYTGALVPFELTINSPGIDKPGYRIESMMLSYLPGDVIWTGWVSDEYVQTVADEHGSGWNRIQAMGSVVGDFPAKEYLSAIVGYTSPSGLKGVFVALNPAKRASIPIGSEVFITMLSTDETMAQGLSFTVTEESFIGGTLGNVYENPLQDNYLGNSDFDLICDIDIRFRPPEQQFWANRTGIYASTHFNPHKDELIKGVVLEKDDANHLPMMGFVAGTPSDMGMLAHLYTSTKYEDRIALKSSYAASIPSYASMGAVLYDSNGGTWVYDIPITPDIFKTGVAIPGYAGVFRPGYAGFTALTPTLKLRTTGMLVGKSAEGINYGWAPTQFTPGFGSMIGTDPWDTTDVISGLWTENGQFVAQLAKSPNVRRDLVVTILEGVNGVNPRTYVLQYQGNGICRGDVGFNNEPQKYLWTRVGRLVPVRVVESYPS